MFRLDYEQHEGMPPLSDENRYGKPSATDLQVVILAVLCPYVVVCPYARRVRAMLSMRSIRTATRVFLAHRVLLC